MANRFRKDNKIFPATNSVNVYRDLDAAEYFCKRCIAKALEEKGKMWNANKPPPNFKVHGFYLVHEDMFKS